MSLTTTSRILDIENIMKTKTKQNKTSVSKFWDALLYMSSGKYRFAKVMGKSPHITFTKLFH